MHESCSVGLCALLALVTTLMTPGADRIWRAASSGLEVLVVLTTFTYFAPNIIRLLDPARTRPAAEAAALLRTWMGFNWAARGVHDRGVADGAPRAVAARLTTRRVRRSARINSPSNHAWNGRARGV